MFLTRTKSKGKTYLYLRCYVPSNKHYRKKKKVYSFGRLEIAVKNMKEWEENFSLFPNELVELGCTKKDLFQWIATIETGITKTGKHIKKVI